MKKPLQAGQVLPLVRRLPFCQDPWLVFKQLTGGRQAGTILLETADVVTKAHQQTLLALNSAVKVVCRGHKVHLSALTDNGQDALQHFHSIIKLQKIASSQQSSTQLTLLFPPIDPWQEQNEKLRSISVFQCLRLLLQAWQPVSQPIASPIMLLGVFAFDLIEQFECLPPSIQDSLGFPDYCFWLPESLLIIDHLHHATTLVENVFGGEHAPNSYFRAQQRIQNIASQYESILLQKAKDYPLSPVGTTALVDIDDAAFMQEVEQLQAHICAGDIFQVVPSRCFSAPCTDPLAAYHALRALNPSPYMYYLYDDDFCLFGASPESAVKVDENRQVLIRPIAGTRPRGVNADGTINSDQDARIEAELRLHKKEVAEHMMLVDLARNDVARVAQPGTRAVPRLLAVDRYSHVMHLVSEVTGKLKNELDALHVYQACMNMGTLTGAPKVKAAQLLRQYEVERRGPYGGAVGYLNANGEMDTAIVIRSAIVKNQTAYVRAGAGVVYDSDPQGEADETRRKAQAVLQALALTEKGPVTAT